MQDKAYFYIIYSPKIDRFYIGSTTNIKHRITQHNSGASNYTKGKGPWFLVYKETFTSINEARKREKEIKKWKSRKRIIKTFSINISQYRDT